MEGTVFNLLAREKYGEVLSFLDQWHQQTSHCSQAQEQVLPYYLVLAVHLFLCIASSKEQYAGGPTITKQYMCKLEELFGKEDVRLYANGCSSQLMHNFGLAYAWLES